MRFNIVFSHLLYTFYFYNNLKQKLEAKFLYMTEKPE